MVPLGLIYALDELASGGKRSVSGTIVDVQFGVVDREKAVAEI